MIKVNAMGDACPIPVVKTKNAIKELNGSGTVEVLVDNEIAVQNLTKMAQQKGYEIQSEKIEEQKYKVLFTIGEVSEDAKADDVITCTPDARNNTVVVVSSKTMGDGNDELGAILMKGFFFALTQQEQLPSTILFYNGGAYLTCEDSTSLEDIKTLESLGVEILTCGTCLNHYGITEKLAVGSVTNMYVIVEKQMQAGHIVKP